MQQCSPSAGSVHSEEVRAQQVKTCKGGERSITAFSRSRPPAFGFHYGPWLARETDRHAGMLFKLHLFPSSSVIDRIRRRPFPSFRHSSTLVVIHYTRFTSQRVNSIIRQTKRAPSLNLGESLSWSTLSSTCSASDQL